MMEFRPPPLRNSTLPPELTESCDKYNAVPLLATCLALLAACLLLTVALIAYTVRRATRDGRRRRSKAGVCQTEIVCRMFVGFSHRG